MNTISSELSHSYHHRNMLFPSYSKAMTLDTGKHVTFCWSECGQLGSWPLCIVVKTSF